MLLHNLCVSNFERGTVLYVVQTHSAVLSHSQVTVTVSCFKNAVHMKHNSSITTMLLHNVNSFETLGLNKFYKAYLCFLSVFSPSSLLRPLLGSLKVIFITPNILSL